MNELGGWVELAQSAAITVAFLFLTWHLPGLAVKWMEQRKEEQAQKTDEADREREFQQKEAEADRAARHAMINTFQEIIANVYIQNKTDVDRLVAAFHDLRVRNETVCRYVRDEKHRGPVDYTGNS